MGRRRRGREAALRMLFEIDVGKTPPEAVVARQLAESELDPESLEFARRLVEGTLAERQRIDELLGGYAREWSLSRMANVDRNVLRLAAYEILYLPDIPASVSVDEAVELAKKYSTGESGKFVNGILGNLIREHAPEKQAAS
jgi:N utilization substance protein B